MDNSPSLIGLGNIGEDDINHREKHPVGHRLAGILDNRNNVCPAGRHVDKISSGSVGELDSLLSWLERVVGNMGL
jgi:hypothetical protein